MPIPVRYDRRFQYFRYYLALVRTRFMSCEVWPWDECANTASVGSAVLGFMFKHGAVRAMDYHIPAEPV